MHLIGDVAAEALMVDDIIDTAGTLVKTAEALISEGATQVFAAACLAQSFRAPPWSGSRSPRISEVVVTDSVPFSEAGRKLSKIKVLSVADLLARGIGSFTKKHRSASCSSNRQESGARKRAMDQTIVEAAAARRAREKFARRMRVAGQVPAVIYGGKDGAVALAVNTKQLSAILRTEGGHNTIFQVKMPTATRPRW